MNQYLKKYTESLLKCYGIPVEGKKVVDEETYQEQYTALKTLETAMWQLCQHAESVLTTEQARNHLEEKGYELIRPTSDHVSKHISTEAFAAALEEYGRTGRKPDELLTDEEIIAGRVQIAAHNLEAKRRHEARQKK
jgi:hypothetical protein